MHLRDKIKNEAVRIAAQDGVGRITVDRVVKGAGTTKGGFFHHFASKEALLQAIVSEAGGVFEAEIERRVATGESFASALIEATLEWAERGRGTMRLLIEAVATDSEFGRVVGADLWRWEERLAREGVPAERRTLLRLAVDGCILGVLLSPEGGVPEASATTLRNLALPAEDERLAVILGRGLAS